MNPAQIEAVFSGQRRDAKAVLLRLLLSCAAPIYAGGSILNRLRYDLKLSPAHRTNVPVISIGNITTGGTGKTPFAAFIVKSLQAQGKQPGIASRGYKSLDNHSSALTENNATGNDEKLVLDQSCPGTPHLQNRNRVEAARQLVTEHACDCVILDDGFQHRRLHRDLDIVLIDAVNPFGYGHLLPRGLLREPLSSLARADLLVITRTEQVSAEDILQIQNQLTRYSNNTPVVEIAFEPTGLIDQHGNQSPIANQPKKPLMFCGIGNPIGFSRLLEGLNYEVTPNQNFFVFPDHHHYTQSEVNQLCDSARQAGTTQLLTTHKDIVKLTDKLPPEITCQAICIEAVIKNGNKVLDQKLADIF
ncbi:MAG: tetraacyldisaccharide 4'-kinase [Planctomycetaceae bacterium]|nr:tetraacyldisaccharide 4'-kinase [Planctomycetaceae bacterium]